MSDIHAKPRRVPLPPLIYVVAIALSLFCHYLYPLPWLSSPLSDILLAVGWLALAAVFALFFTAVRAMRRAKTTLDPNGVPEHLVTSGPFSITRNPMYFANTLLMIGVGLISGITWFPIFAVIAAFTTQKLAIEREEKLLMERFGKKYLDYTKRVRRWI